MSAQTTPDPTRDETTIFTHVPRTGEPCRSYASGHNVHWIPVLSLSPTQEPVTATIDAHPDGITLTVEGEPTPMYNHDPDAIAGLIEQFGSTCQWYPQLRLANWRDGTGGHWVSLAESPFSPCLDGPG